MAEIDPQVNDSWDQVTLEAFTTNIKRIVDEWAEVSHNKAVANANLQDQLNAQYLRWADDAHMVTQRMASDGASLSQLQANAAAILSQRAGNNAATWDNLVAAGEVDTTAQGAMANNLANQMRSVAFETVQSALAQAATSSAPAQGSTGSAATYAQLSGGVATAAIISQMAKMQAAIDILTAKILGEETTQEKPVTGLG
jgi:hypothetical protein